VPALFGAGDEWLAGEGEEGDLGLLGVVAEAIPIAACLFGGIGHVAEVEKDEGEVAIGKEPVGGFPDVVGVLAAEPEKPGGYVSAVAGGVEAIGAVDQSDLVVLGIEDEVV